MNTFFSCINEIYNVKVRKNLYYQWVAKHVKTPKVERKVGSYNFQHVQQHHNLIFTLTTRTLTMNEDLVDFYNLISNVRGKKEFYVIDTYFALINFLWSWPKFREKKGISLVGLEHDCLA
jgi:hypothetical protein